MAGLASSIARDSSSNRVGYFYHTIKKEDLRPGDHVYVYSKVHRSSETEHAIYCGDDQVIHLVKDSASIQIVHCLLEQFSQGRELQLVSYGASHAARLIKKSYAVHTYNSLPPNVVLQHAREFLHDPKLWPNCSLLFNDDESFAFYCKTMISRISGPVDKPFTRKTINRSHLKPGDHIYVKRYGGIYSHHGIYVGRKGSRKEIIHFSVVDGSRKITETCLDDFLLGGDLNVVRYGVPAREKHEKKMEQESAHPYQSRPVADVLETAEYFRDNPDQWNKYHVLNNNCETFAIYCKTWCPNYAGQGLLSRILPSVGAYRDWLEQLHAQVHEAPPSSYIDELQSYTSSNGM